MFKASVGLWAVVVLMGLEACSSTPQHPDANGQVPMATDRPCVTDRATGSNLMKKETCYSKLAQAQDQRAADKAAMDEMKRNAQPTEMGSMHR